MNLGKGGKVSNRGTVSAPHEGYISSQIIWTPGNWTEARHTQTPNDFKSLEGRESEGSKMGRCTETREKGGTRRQNLPHSVHGFRTNNGNNLCAWYTWRRYMKNPRCLSQCRNGRGRENGPEWEVRGTNGKYCAPNIQKSQDIWEGKAGPIRQPNKGSLYMNKIGIAVLWTACDRHEM